MAITHLATTARATAEAFGVPLAFADDVELVSHPEVDAVAITVKVPEHDRLIRAALAAGRARLCHRSPVPPAAGEDPAGVGHRDQPGRHLLGSQPARKGPRVPVISPSHRDLLETPHTVVFATVGTDGQPQVTAIWAMLDGDLVRTSLYKGRQKYKNLFAHPQVTLFVIDPENPYRTLEVRATAEITDDPDLEFLQRLLHLYGSDLETFKGPTEERVVITLNPTRIVENG